MINKLNIFIEMICGRFNNNEQYINDEINCKINNVKAKYINAICNDKIMNLPKNFPFFFVIEESYYETIEKTTILPHLFLFDVNEDNKIRLTSYIIPSEFRKEEFTNDNMNLKFDYKQIALSEISHH